MSKKVMPTESWCRPNGNVVSCTEKVKVLDENYEELRDLYQEALDDAVLMGCSIEQVRRIYLDMIQRIEASYPEQLNSEEHLEIKSTKRP